MAVTRDAGVPFHLTAGGHARPVGGSCL